VVLKIPEALFASFCFVWICIIFAAIQKKKEVEEVFCWMFCMPEELYPEHKRRPSASQQEPSSLCPSECDIKARGV